MENVEHSNLGVVAYRWLVNKPENTGLVMMHERLGVHSFAVFLEYRRFTPGTPLNSEYNICMLQWEGIIWDLLIVPTRKLYQADEMMLQLGLRRISGVPHMVKMENGAIAHVHFPLNLPNMYTVENIPGHFVYQNDPMLNKTAAQFEKEAIEREIAEFDARRRNVL